MNMEKMKICFLLLAAAFTFSACGNEDDGAVVLPEPVKQEPEIHVAEQTVMVPTAGGEIEMTITTSGKWTASLSVDDVGWLSMPTQSGEAGVTTLVLKALANATNYNRQATLSLNLGNTIQEIKIGQLARQYEILMQIFDNESLKRAEKFQSWGDPSPEAKWFGIETNEAGEIVKIDVSISPMNGQIPESIGELTSLEELKMANCGLKGPIPASIGKLTKLQCIELMLNDLTGEIPASIGNLTELSGLYLYLNHLEGNIPPELGKLKNLQHLRLDQNALYGAIPAELGNLEKLNSLNLSNNTYVVDGIKYVYDSLSGEIPASFANLKELSLLQLNNNHLSGDLAVITQMPNLREVDLDYNKFTGGIPAGIGGLSQLVMLHLAGNPLGGELPEEIGDLSVLEDLMLADCGLTGELPASYGKLSKLRLLNMALNELTGSIPDEWTGMTSLVSLWLVNNYLSGELSEEVSAWLESLAEYNIDPRKDNDLSD